MAHMCNPPHPGLTLRDDVLPALGLSVTEAAQQLGVSRVTLSRVLNGRAAISPEMAFRIEAWLGKERGGDARVWLAEQLDFDTWQAEQRVKAVPLNVKPAPVALAVCERMKTLHTFRVELLADPAARAEYEALAPEFETARELVAARTGRVLQLPTSEEDAAITAAAHADPGAVPFTDAEWAQVKTVEQDLVKG